MKILVVDVETTTFDKGNPFSICNKLCYVGLYDGETYELIDIEYGCEPYGEKLRHIKQRIEEADLIVMSNAKFDINWLRRYISDLCIRNVYCCQLAEFVLSCQRQIMPSLDYMSERYSLGNKSDIVRINYWDKGIDTTDVPREILEEYLRGDLLLTWGIYEAQQKLIKDSPKKALIDLCNEDLLVLQKMEENGLPTFREEEALRRSEDITKELEQNGLDLDRFVTGSLRISWDSPSQVSTYLFGGTLQERVRVPSQRVLKDGSLQQREVWGEKEHVFPRLIQPIGEPGDSGNYSVKEDILQQLNWGKYSKIKNLLLRRRELNKLQGTYLEGLVKLRKEQDLPEGKLHPTYSQCVVVTGRLASSGPNGQNVPLIVRELFGESNDTR